MSQRSVSSVYVVTGALSAGKTSFITQCATRRGNGTSRLFIQFEMGMETLEGDSLYVPIRDVQSQTDDQLAARMGEAVMKARPEEIWIEWNGMLPVGRLLSILSAKPLHSLCKLRRVIQVADGQEYMAQLSQTGSMLLEQAAQCDLAVVRDADKKQLLGIRRSLKGIQSGGYTLAFSDGALIDSVLYSANIREPIKILTVLTAIVAAFYLFTFFKLSIPNSVTVFLGTWLQAIPFLLLGILLSSVIQVFVSVDFIRRMFPKNAIGGMLFGVFGGFLLPVCDCASIPVFRSLVKKGVPLPAAVTFMTAAPVINPVVMLSTYYAYGGNGKVVLARVVLGILCSLIIGLFFVKQKGSIFASQVSQVTCACCIPEGTDRGGRAKLKQLANHFRNELFEVAKFLLMGIAISTFFQMALGSNLTKFQPLHLAGAMLLMMLMAFLLSLCSSSDAVVGKNMGASLPMGAVMGFLVFGPMMDIKNLILMSSNLSRRFIVKLTVVIFAVCFAVVYAASLLGLGGWIQ